MVEGKCMKKSFALIVLAIVLCIIFPSCHTIYISTPYSEYVYPEEEEAAADTPETLMHDEDVLESVESIHIPLPDESSEGFTGSELLGTVSYSGPESDEDEITISISLWETEERRALMNEAIALYEAEHPGVKIIPDYVDFSGYWGNISADAAGGKLSDIIEMDRAHISQFSERGLLYDFTRFISGLYGYGLPIGLKADVMQYDESILEDLGLVLPEAFTFEDFSAISREIYDRTGIKTATSLSLDFLEAISSRRGRSIYSEIMNEETDSTEAYFSLVKTVAENPFYAYSNDETWNTFTDTANLNPAYRTICFSDMGFYSLFSITSSSEHPDVAMDFIIYLVSSDVLTPVFRFSFGVPVFRDIRDITLTEDEKEQLDLILSLGSQMSIAMPPNGNREVSRLLSSYSALVREGSISPEEAADEFIAEAKEILLRARNVI